MQRGQPLQFSDLVPFGLSTDDFLTLVVTVASFFLIWSIGNGFIERDKMGPRLKALQERRKELRGEAIKPRKRKREQGSNDWMKTIVSSFKIIQENQSQKITMSLVQAGYRSRDAIIVYAFAKLVCPFAGLIIGFMAVDINWDDPFTREDAMDWLIIIGGGYISARLPDLIVTNGRQKRHHAIRRALADTLDLMLICAEAGLSLTASLDRVARELGQAYPEMGEELRLTSIEIGFLPERNIALKHLAERVDMPEIRSIVNVLLQTEKYGTPVSQALRVLSRDFRTERMLRAEQKAAKLPALMTVPMIVFILPTLFVVIISPAVIKVLDI